MMARLTIVLGVLLVVIGVGGYFATARSSATALIPAYFGAAFAVLGAIALKESCRRHAMHAAAALGVLGVLGNATAPVKLAQMIRGIDVPHATAVYLRVAMLLLCLGFVLLCVKSFIDARRNRLPQ